MQQVQGDWCQHTGEAWSRGTLAFKTGAYTLGRDGSGSSIKQMAAMQHVKTPQNPKESKRSNHADLHRSAHVSELTPAF